MENKLVENALPDDINLEERKSIIKDQLRKLLGKSLPEKEVQEKRRLKNIEFQKKAIRRRIANASRRRNRV